ncbi:hypothetical protein H0H81_008319 [Sphagnurus paluster]|uniref:PNPLA domain-containing protein n=1 Tax=Sphagnurus paluster TaxID=117069 RepID=A0A9P7GV86_9AGAR|nr:hypothetical protein H0H81_008319 [Sphagnurus paluster]
MSAGSWSWFEVIVLDSPEASEPKVKDGLSLVWLSHYNKLCHKEYTHRIGQVFGSDHDIFRGLEVGNALAVRLCARFRGWKNDASEGNFVLKVSEHGRKSGPTPSPEAMKYWEAIAEQVATLSKEFHDMLDKMTPPDAPPAYSPLIDFVPKEPLRADQIKLSEEPPLKVMSFDGGGVRGISSLYILKEIMSKVSPNNPDLKPCQYFDMIVGTSTGGLIAIMLGRLQMTVSECIEAYNTLSSSIFSEKATTKFTNGYWYKADNFEKAAKALIKKKTGDENALMRDPDPNNKCKVFVVSTGSQNVAKIHQIRTYPSRVADPFPDCKIWEAAQATAAAPTYLPPITINNIELVDGALGKNNPISLLFAEMNVLFGDPKFLGCGFARPINCFLSIGTGMQPRIEIKHTKPKIPGESTLYFASLAEAALALAVNTEDGHTFAEKMFSKREGVYFRFNVGVKKGEDWEKLIDMDDWAGMPKLVEITKQYLLGEAKRVEECASKIN